MDPRILWPVLTPQPVNDWTKQYVPTGTTHPIRERAVGKRRITPFVPTPTVRPYTIERHTVVDSGAPQCVARGARRRLLF